MSEVNGVNEVSGELTQEQLKELLYYDPETGVFIWRPQAAGYIDTSNGKSRWKISINGRWYFCAPLAWLYMTGEWPKDQVDHKDRDSLNDSWENLRQATVSQNMANRAGWAKSGFKGVHQKGRRFQALITVEGVQVYRGTFDTAEEAYEEYKRAALEFFGEFACYD